MSQRRTFVSVPAAVLVAAQRGRAAPPAQRISVATPSVDRLQQPVVEGVKPIEKETVVIIAPRDGTAG